MAFSVKVVVVISDQLVFLVNSQIAVCIDPQIHNPGVGYGFCAGYAFSWYQAAEYSVLRCLETVVLLDVILLLS